MLLLLFFPDDKGPSALGPPPPLKPTLKIKSEQQDDFGITDHRTHSKQPHSAATLENQGYKVVTTSGNVLATATSGVVTSQQLLSNQVNLPSNRVANQSPRGSGDFWSPATTCTSQTYSQPLTASSISTSNSRSQHSHHSQNHQNTSTTQSLTSGHGSSRSQPEHNKGHHHSQGQPRSSPHTVRSSSSSNGSSNSQQRSTSGHASTSHASTSHGSSHALTSHASSHVNRDQPRPIPGLSGTRVGGHGETGQGQSQQGNGIMHRQEYSLFQADICIPRYIRQ